jgi:hypothetical protein
MRTWIYNRANGLLQPLGWVLFGAGAADNPASRPFAVLAMDPELPTLGMPVEMRTQSIPFTIWLHDAPGSMLKIDDAAIALKVGMPTNAGALVGGMSVYECRWEMTGNDAYDDHYNTSSRPVRFSLITRR